MAERVRPLSKSYPDAPQAKRTLRLESIQERAGNCVGVADLLEHHIQRWLRHTLTVPATDSIRDG